MHLSAVTREPSNSHVFKSLVVHPEARLKFMGYKTVYLFLSVITQSWPGHQTLIIIPEAVHPCCDFHDKVTWGAICPLHTMYPTLHSTSQATQLRQSKDNAGLSGEAAGGTSAQAWLTDKSFPSLPRAQGIKIFHPFLPPASPAASSPLSKAAQKDGAG